MSIKNKNKLKMAGIANLHKQEGTDIQTNKIYTQMKILLIMAICFSMFSCTHYNIVSEETIRERNEEITNAKNNNETWASDPLAIVFVYYGEGIYCTEKEIKMTSLNKGERNTDVKISVKIKYRGEFGGYEYEKYIFYLKEENDIWQFYKVMFR